MRKKTSIAVGVIISLIGFFLAIVSVVIETHIHRDIRDSKGKTDEENYNDLMFKKSMLGSFAEICIFLGFLIMNMTVVIHLWEKL